MEADTDVENVAEQRALTRAGFRREGIARGAQWRAGVWRDLVIYSKLRTDEVNDAGLHQRQQSPTDISPDG